MKTIFIMLLLGATAVAQAPATIPVNPVDKQLIQTLNSELETLNARMRANQAERETIRLRSCLAASVPLVECGQWGQDGQIPRLHPDKQQAP